jgi:hypothetical protein
MIFLLLYSLVDTIVGNEIDIGIDICSDIMKYSLQLMSGDYND